MGLLAVAASLALAVHAAARAPFFPIGLYQVNDAKDLREIKDAGFNAVTTGLTKPEALLPLAREARRRGLRLLLDPEGLMSAKTSTRGWPMLAWYLYDEPDVHHLSPAALADIERRVKAWDPLTPTAFVVGYGPYARRYKDSGDFIMADWYPVPHLPLESAGETIGTAVDAVGKPVWAVLQAMDWRDYVRRTPPVGRFPDVLEMRFMSYDAVCQGARGLWYFSFTRPNSETLPEIPEHWLALREVAREMAAMRPIFERGAPAPLPFRPDPDGPAARAWAYRGRDYVLMLNRGKTAALPLPAELLDRRWRPLFEIRRDPRELLRRQGDRWALAPYQVMVFEGPFRWRAFLAGPR